MEFLSSKPILAKEAEEKIAHAKKKVPENELGYNENLIIEHSDVISSTPSELKKGLKELSDLTDETTAIKLLDTLPQTKESVNAVFISTNNLQDDEKAEKCLVIIKKFSITAERKTRAKKEPEKESKEEKKDKDSKEKDKK